jgi:hypothetical protein
MIENRKGKVSFVKIFNFLIYGGFLLLILVLGVEIMAVVSCLMK